MTAHPVLAVIPARGGSKGLPGKNIRPLAGLPLIVHSVRCAAMTPEIARAVVSTDSEQIAAVARAAGADVPFMRPAHLASDTAAMWPVIQHALDEVERAQGQKFGSVLLLDPTSPGRTPMDIAEAVAALERDADCDGVIGVSEPAFNPYWYGVVDDGSGYMRDLIPGAHKYARRQEVPKAFRINGTLYLWRADFVRRATDWRTGRLRMQEVPESRAVNIDDIDQFRLVEWLIETGGIELPWLSR